ncbi:serendipity locus protein H-1-like isoform X2 [Plectropomus leopardus]|uniref:serendipity locus protein H-1-like isoform X2 n=1 Tax=Plectropomus leopardus TaxID=160734 RepID=UPI001C4CAD96|nr:serendipity locus protein H-1-like isoform X2 [Plectropomus leopardus]
MDLEEDEVSSKATRPETEITADLKEAAKPSPDWTEPSSGRRGSKRRAKTAVTSPDYSDSRSGVRVLRARGAGAGKTIESKDVTRKQKPTSLHSGGRGRPAGSRSRSTPVMQPAIKKPTVKKASKHTLGPKLSKSRKGKVRPPTHATTPATACKPEAEMEVSSCGEETGTLKGNNANVTDPDAALEEDTPFRDDPNDVIYKPQTKTEKSRRRTTLKQKEVKKEEPEKEEEEDDIKKEESTEIVVQSEDGMSNSREPTRKKGRQLKDDKVPRLPKQRKKPPVQYVRCEIEGCGTVLAHPRYLQHHIKYQHLLKKKYVCDHPSCGRLFRLQKQLLRHAKHHTDQRDYICEFCARAFKSSHNLAVHRMIHTGEKPIQCEICGFTCRQKASLNWHMKKHDAEASYQFSCSICSKKFEKKDSVVAHKAKSHPEVLIAEALAANEGAVISTPNLISETRSVLSMTLDTSSVLSPTSKTVPVLNPTSETVQVLHPTSETVPVLNLTSETVPALTPTSETVPVLNPTSETVPVLNQPDQLSVGPENQEVMNSTLTPLQQVVLPLAPQTQIDVSQSQFLQLPMHRVVQVAHQQQAPTLLHLTTASPAHLSSISHPQLIQLSTLPASNVTSMTIADPQSTLLTLSSVTTLASTASLASQQAVQWGREAHEDAQLPGEGELWDRVVVGGVNQDVGEMMWEGNGERRKEDGWEREGERQILLQCAEVQGDSLI